MQATLDGGGVIVRGPGVRGLLAVGTTSGDMLLLDPASGYKVRSWHAILSRVVVQRLALWIAPFMFTCHLVPGLVIYGQSLGMHHQPKYA